MCLEISNFDFVSCWGAPSVVAMPSRWVSTSDRLKGLPPDLLQTRGHKSGFDKDDKKARSEFQRSARTWGAVVHQRGSPTLAVGPCTRMAENILNTALMPYPLKL